MSKPTISNSLQGKLVLSDSGWVLLSLPAAIQRGFFAALDAPGAELPIRNGRLNTHISVIRPEELAAAGNPKITELGKHFRFNLGRLVETNPLGWEEMERVWFFRVVAPELVALRRSYGLTDFPRKGRKQLDFHLTIATRRSGVLGKSRAIAKQSQEDFDWQHAGQVAEKIADALQDLASNQALSDMSDGNKPYFRPGQFAENPGSPTIERLGTLAQFWDGKIMGVPNKPSALASMLTLGILGAGLGYGGGALGGSVANRVFGRNVDPKRMRRMGALAGGAVGILPGAFYALLNAKAGKNPLTGDILNDRIPKSSQFKIASGTGAAFDADHFAKLVNENPFNVARLDPRERAMATGLVYGARSLPGRSPSPLVTPVDIGRMAVGMGSGYLSGMIVGKTLGGLMGLPQTQQDKLIRAGVFAGAVKNIIPNLFQGGY